MNQIADQTSGGTPPPGSRRRRLFAAGGLIAAGTLTGGILASTMSASAATTAPSASSSSSGQSSGSAQTPARGHGGSTPVRSDEKSLSATDAAKVKAAALAAVPGGTVYRVETDAGDGTYEAHMTKADGTLVTVKLNASFAVTKVEAGMGLGDPRLKGQPSGSGGAGGPGGSAMGGSAA
jgi:hypothetical protein